MLQGKKFKTKSLLECLAVFGLVIFLFFVLRATWNLYQKNRLARTNLQSSTGRLTRLTERRSSLQNKIERLKTPRGIEEEIRNNFPMVKEGEQVINIVEQGPETTTTSTSTKPWWQIW